MAKIILSKDDSILREMTLSKERITIGRRPHNDIMIDDLAISGEHAVIVTQNGDSFLEDLNSTNGTQVNGQPVRMHFFQNGDVVELARYRIRYVDNEREKRPVHSLNMNAPDSCRNDEDFSEAARLPALIKVINGANAGEIKFLKKPLTTIGVPGNHVAAIAWRNGNYYILHIEGNAHIYVNGHPIGVEGQLVTGGELIDLAGTVMEFSLLPFQRY